MKRDLTFVICQIETVSCDIEGNTERIINAIKCARIRESIPKDTSLVMAFPKTAITGYNCGNMYNSDVFINAAKDALYEIAEYVKSDEYVIIGSIRKHKDKLYNTAFLINNGLIIDMYSKQHLADSAHHDDSHWFTPGDETKVFNIEGNKVGIAICEDSWNTERDLYKEMKDKGAKVVVSINNSYNTFNKFETRYNVFASKDYFIPTIYVNNVGMGDIGKNYFAYDGRSFVMNKPNKINTYVMKVMYKPDICYVSFKKGDLKCMYIDDLKIYDHNEVRPLLFTNTLHGYEYNLSKVDNIIQTCIYGIKQSFKLSCIKNAQVHMSGGLDSAVVGALTYLALGRENVTFISNPSKNNGDITKGNVAHMSEILGIDVKWEPIQEYVDIYKSQHPDATPKQIATFEADIRSAIGLADTHENKSAIVSCGNHTENLLGFFNFHDIGSIGLLQPIGDLTKMEVMEVAERLNKKYLPKKDTIPPGLYDGSIRPSAELEDNLGEDPYNYKIMSVLCSQICRECEWDKEALNEVVFSELRSEFNRFNEDDIKLVSDHIDMATRLIVQAVYKRAQSAPILILNDKLSVGFSNRETLINRFKAGS